MKTPLLSLIALLLAVLPAQAASFEFLEKIVADTDPTAFEVAPFAPEDYALDWAQPLPGATARLLPGSLQWVRVDELLVVPRALLEVSAPGLEGSVRSGGIIQPLSGGKARVLVALVSGEENPIEIRTPGKTGTLKIRFAPREQGHRIYLDTSCSRTRLAVDSSAFPADAWAYIGCRSTRNYGEGVVRSDLDLLVFADNLGPVRIGGAEAPAADPGRWNLRLTSLSREATLEGARGALKLSAQVPEQANRAFLGAGVGPYKYEFEKGTTKVDTTVPLATLYSAYVLTSTNRVVFFAALAAHKHLYADAGLYFQFESFRAFDRRISLNLLLGGHGFSYTLNGTRTTRLNFPQGFELFFFDILGRGKNASFGGFVQPPIDDKSYYNMWLRWGPTSWFLEANYISVAEPGSTIKSYGLSVGFPLVSFW